MDTKVKTKVESIVNQMFVTDTKEVQRHVKDFVINTLYEGQEPPPSTNQRFFPTSKNLKNCIDATLSSLL